MKHLKFTFIAIAFAVILSFFTIDAIEKGEKPLVIVVPSYNNAQWYQLNLDSILAQNYTNYRVIYINDCSKDDTGKLVEEYLKKVNVDHRRIDFDDSKAQSINEKTKLFSAQINNESHFFTLINNINRSGALSNLYRAILSSDDNAIIVTVDGDDWLIHPEVFSQLNKIYSSKSVWLTHGTLKEHPYGNVSWCEPVPKHIIWENKFRSFKCPSHLRTFYAWLFKSINLKDLLYEEDFFAMAWDMAIMYPMIEMAGERHAFIKEPNYVYNMENQINDNKVNAELQRKLDLYIRNMKPYKRL